MLSVVLKLSCSVADTDSKHQDGIDVYVNISSHKLKLLFEMVPGIKTSNFVGEIFRAIEGNRRKILYSTHFDICSAVSDSCRVGAH
jgi:hypothetical protein